MKSSLEKVSSLERKLNVEIPVEAVQNAITDAIKDVQREVTIKGFRKGKAPLATVRSIYGDRVKQDVLQDLIQKYYTTALKEHGLEPITFPSIEFDPLEDEKPFAFTAEFEIRPEVKVQKFEKLSVKKEKFAPKEDVVDKTLSDVQKGRAELKPLLIMRPAQLGDVAVLDFEGFLLTGPLENGAAKGHELELGSNQFIPGFEEGVVGMSVGQEKSIAVSFPENYHVPELAGKPVTFKVTLHDLKKREMPELNDEFAKKLGPFESLEALKVQIRNDYQQSEERRIKDEFKNRVVRALVAANPVEVPKGLMIEQKKALIEDFQKRMSEQGMNKEQFEDYKSKWDSDFESTASFMIRSSFLIDAVGKAQDLKATEADVDAKVNEYAKQSGIDVSRVREFYNSEERRSRLRYQIAEDKVVDFLISKADVKEVTREEIEKDEKEAMN